jgi:protein-disulfide isomerase
VVAGLAVAASGAVRAASVEERYAEKAMGKADAPVTMIEYSSLTCPHCASFHKETLPRIKESYIDTGKVRLVYRDFPFDRLALRAAQIAHCAGKDRYFAFLDVLFRNQENWSRDKDPMAALARLAKLGGIGQAEHDVCVGDQKLIDSILMGRQGGEKEFNVESTPTFIINGHKVLGALPFADFQKVIDGQLAKAGRK